MLCYYGAINDKQIVPAKRHLVDAINLRSAVSIQRLTTVICLALSGLQPTQASVLGWLGIGEAGENAGKHVAASIDNAMLTLSRLQSKFDQNVDKYLDRIDEISTARLDEFLNGSRSLAEAAAAAINDIRQIQRDAFYDARRLIWDVECLGTVYRQDLKETLGDLISIVSDSKAKIKLPFGVSGKLLIQEVDISSPDIAYEDIKEGYLQTIETTTDETRVLTILSAYGNISRLALKTSCHYRGTWLEKYFLGELAYYESQAAPWATITGLNNI